MRRSVRGLPVDVHVRGIDPEVWKALRQTALERGEPVAKVIERLWNSQLAGTVPLRGRDPNYAEAGTA